MNSRIEQSSNGRKNVDVESLLQKLNRFLPVKHRHVLTQRNTVRLRFVVVPGASMLALTLLAGTALMPALSSGVSQPPVEVAMVQQAPVILGPADPAPTTGDALPAVAAAVNSAQDPAVANVAQADQVPQSDDRNLFQRLVFSQKRLQRSQDDVQQAQQLASIEPAASEPAKPLQSATTQEKTVKIGNGDTLTGALTRAGLSSDEAYEIAQAMKQHVDPRNLKPGQTLNVKFDKAPDENNQSGFQFASLKMAVDPLHTVSVNRSAGDDSLQTNVHEQQMEKHLYAQEATVEGSLYGAAAKAGIPQAVVAEAIRVYSWNVDFQRDIQPGDKLQVMYEQYQTPAGQKIKTGNLLYAKLVLGDEEMPIYRYEMKDGHTDYFQPNGRSIKKTLMKTPIDGARISSGFGMRMHPILGYSKMHKGIDFAAVTGTPIYAAGDGVIEKAGRFSGYGNYIRIRHTSELSTAYGHMSRFAPESHPGAHVHQGDVIGYVGMTGGATGPHLHYEILVNNVQVNPRGVNLPTGEILEGQQLKLFQIYAKQIDHDLVAHRTVNVAENKPADSGADEAATTQ